MRAYYAVLIVQMLSELSATYLLFSSIKLIYASLRGRKDVMANLKVMGLHLAGFTLLLICVCIYIYAYWIQTGHETAAHEST